MSKADNKKSKFSAKKSLPWNKYNWEDMVYEKVETKAIPGEGKGDYNNLCFNYQYSEDEVGELRVKWADLDNCWISPYVDKEKDNKVTWSITHYFELGANKEFDEFIVNLSKGHLGLLEENKDKLDANADLADKNFDPTDMKAVSDLWGGFITRVKGAPKGSTRRKLKWKSNKGGKPDTRRFPTETEIEENIKKGMSRADAQKKMVPIDAEYVAQKKCKLRIISRNPQIYCAQKIHPQNIVYSCIILDLDESGQAPDDLFDDEVDDLFVGNADAVKKGANKLAGLEAAGKPKLILGGKPAAAGGSKGDKDGDKDEKKEKAVTGIAAKMAEKQAKAKEAAKKAAEGKSEVAKKSGEDKKKSSPKDSDSE